MDGAGLEVKVDGKRSSVLSDIFIATLYIKIKDEYVMLCLWERLINTVIQMIILGQMDATFNIEMESMGGKWERNWWEINWFLSPSWTLHSPTNGWMGGQWLIHKATTPWHMDREEDRSRRSSPIKVPFIPHLICGWESAFSWSHSHLLSHGHLYPSIHLSTWLKCNVFVDKNTPRRECGRN